MRGQLRYWAAAKAAAGVASESYAEETLAAALAAARARHDDRFAAVLDRCSFVVDDAPVGGRDHGGVRLREGGVVDVLPPFAGGGPDPVAGATQSASQAASSPRAALAAGVLGAAAALALAAASYAGMPVLLLAVLLLQAGLVAGWFATLGLDAGAGPAVVSMASAVAADGLVVRAADASLARLAGVIGMSVVGALAAQLVRRGRSRVTEGIGATVAGAAFCAAAATLLGLRAGPGGVAAVAVVAVAAGAALLAARAVDLVLPRPALAPGLRRGWPAPLTGLAVAIGLGALCAGPAAVLAPADGALLGLAAGLVAVAVDAGVGLGVAAPARQRAVGTGPGHGVHRDRAAQLRDGAVLLGGLLPLALIAPASYVVGRLLLS